MWHVQLLPSDLIDASNGRASPCRPPRLSHVVNVFEVRTTYQRQSNG